MKVRLPIFINQRKLTIFFSVTAFTLVINTAILSGKYFEGWRIFLFATFFGFITTCADLILCSIVKTALKNRFPLEQELFKKLSLTIFAFLLINALYLYSLFVGYERLPIYNYQFDENHFIWIYLALGILNVFLVFLMEGLSNYREWKKNRRETEKLNETYKRSQLNGLKSQVNPHFLFNSLNSLSSLIQEDEDRAEKFLDEMSKVYRYMLRSDDEQLVPLETELKFVQSYTHLLKERYGEGLQIKILIKPDEREKLIPALALQVIIENTFSQNIIDKLNPLTIEIMAEGNGVLQVKNSIRPKKIVDAIDFEVGLDNLIKKYGLLNHPVSISDVTSCRIINLPLISKKETATV